MLQDIIYMALSWHCRLGFGFSKIIFRVSKTFPNYALSVYLSVAMLHLIFSILIL
jgi:hypothetical protein